MTSSCTRLLTALLLLLSGPTWAQLTLSTADAARQNFDVLGTSATATLPAGFQLAAGTSPVYDNPENATATTRTAGTSGSGALNATSAGAAYNFADGIAASSTDRALGFITSGGYTSPRSILLAVRNTSGQTLTELRVAYDIEKYRAGLRPFNWQFFTSPDGTSWTVVPAGAQSYDADGENAVVNPATTQSKDFTLTGLNLANGATLYLRWYHMGSGGSTNGQGLALDNLVLTPTLSGAPATPTITTGAISGSPFCGSATAGTSVAVPFTATGALTGTFAAQLSDATGTFPADLSQGLIGSGTTSPLAATLPAATPVGSGYRIRVLHVASATVGTPNTADLTISNPPATNAVTLTPATAQRLTTTESGSIITATAEAPSTFAWFYATSSAGPFSTVISGATAATYTPRGADFGAAGTYYLVARATSTCGSVVDTSAPITLTISAPTPIVTATPNPVPDFGTVAVGTASGDQRVTLSGSNLAGDVTLTPPAGFQLRTGTGAFSCAALTLPVTDGSLSATVQVRFVPEAARAYTGQVALTSSGTASLAGIEVTGTGATASYPPSLSTAAVTAITATTGTAGGEVLTDGGSPITVRGVAYASTEAPTTQDDFTTDGSGSGTFSSALTGLRPNTTYYVRAYATNAQGTAYGEQVRFITAPAALAAEPTQASTLTATAVTPTTVALGLGGGNGSRRLLLVTQGPALNFRPQDGTTYAANAQFGQGDQPAPGTYVVLATGAASVTVTGLLANTEYTFAVFDYNDDATSGSENYLLAPYGELTLSTPAQPAGLLFTENFDYAAGERLTALGWNAHSGAGANPVLVTSSGLSFAGYAPSGGNAAALTASGEDVHRTFPSQTAGTAIYATLLVNVSAVNGADYFFHLGPDPISTTFRARLFVRAASTSGKVQFGVSGSGTATIYSPTEYDLNTTHLLMVRYVFGPSGTETRLYINPGAQEPTTADAVNTEAATSAPTNIGSVAFRQGANTSPLRIDGLRVATAYEQARAFTVPLPLPVTLTRFTAQRQPTGRVQLYWATAQELNARAYHVERSLDGRSFTTVATQAAAGTTNRAQQYTALDAAAPASQLYYRLTQQDTDGALHYSAVVSVASGIQAAAALSVAPNPAAPAQPLTLTLTGRAGQAGTLQLLDAVGRVQYTQALRPLTAAEQLPLTLPATLPAGTYLLRVVAPGRAPLHTRLVLTR